MMTQSNKRLQLIRKQSLHDQFGMRFCGIDSCFNFQAKTESANNRYHITRHFFDALGRVLTRNGDSFDYDARSQVTNAVIAAHHFAHAYDEIGNHVYAGADADINLITNNSLNQTTSYGDELITWNADGGMASDANWNYEYDAQDRLVSVTSRMLANDAIRVHNSYDYRNRRISKAIDRYDSLAGDWHLSECHEFVWDDLNIIHETISIISGSVTNVSEHQYFWGDDLSNSAQGAGGIGGLLAVSINNNYYLPAYDFNGNITAYVSESGNLAAWYAYDGFGNTIDSYGDSSSFFFRFCTKYHDAETGMYYYGRRFYLPHLGRWINRDPIEEDGGENLYGMCANNLNSNYDKNGCAYFALRRLKGLPWIPGLSKNEFLSKYNLELAHEQLFYEDNDPNKRNNLGFSDVGIISESGTQYEYFRLYGGYNDCVMREAEKLISYTKEDYSVFWLVPKARKCNCQDFADSLRRQYNYLMKLKKIRCKCGLEK